MNKNFLQLMLVTNKGSADICSYLTFVETCLKAGVTSVQLREKSLSHEALFEFGYLLKTLLDKYNIPLIVNDHVDLCIQLKAYGVHVGQSDTAVAQARKLLGSNKIIGLTVNNVEQVKQAATLPIDYLGVGALFPTNNKPNIETIWGVDGLQKISRISAHPIVAIGGINETNAACVMHAGAYGIAAIGAFHDTKDPYSTTKKLITLIKDKQKIEKALVDKSDV